MKYAISFLGILLLVICGTLFFQYHAYSDHLDTGEGDFTYTQEIEITYRSGSLDIRQHFHNLSNQAIDITWPNLAVSTDCFLESEASCDRLSEDKTRFEAMDGRNASLSYVIQLDGGLKSNQLLKDIFVTLKDGHASYTTVHISTDSGVKGQWITGLPILGNQSLSLVNYSMFGGPGEISELYWHSGEMGIQKAADLITIYSHKQISKELLEQLKAIKFLNKEHIVIVEGKNLSAQQGKRILFLDELSIEALNEKVILSQVKNQYDLEKSPEWVSEVIASFLSESTIGSNKSIGIVNTLSGHMTDEQKLSWVQKLNDAKGKKLTTKKLDEILSDVYSLHTKFFEMNETVEGQYPLLFNDKREVFVDNKPQEDVDVIFRDGQILYALEPLLKSLGYQTSVGENGYYVQNEMQQFRFPQGYGFYVYNEQRYDTISEPVSVIANSFYMEETWLQRLFNLDIQKNESTITIQQQ